MPTIYDCVKKSPNCVGKSYIRFSAAGAVGNLTSRTGAFGYRERRPTDVTSIEKSDETSPTAERARPAIRLWTAGRVGRPQRLQPRVIQIRRRRGSCSRGARLAVAGHRRSHRCGIEKTYVAATDESAYVCGVPGSSYPLRSSRVCVCAQAHLVYILQDESSAVWPFPCHSVRAL